MKARTVIVTALILAVQSTAWFLWWREDPSIARENGPMENLQAAAILAGLVLLVIGMLRAPLPGCRVCLAGLALFYLNFVFLEVDTRSLGVPWLAWLCNDRPRAVLLGSLWAAGGIWYLFHWRATLRCFFGFLLTAPGAWLGASSFFWVLGRLAEVLLVDKATKLFVEEVSETNAALLMILAAQVLSRAAAGHRTPVAAAEATSCIPATSGSVPHE